LSQKPPPPPSGRSPSPASRGRINARLYLITPTLDDPSAFAPQLEAALGAGDVAAVLLALADADERTLVNRAKSIAAIVQKREVALLLDNRPELVGRVGADGAHVSGIEAFVAALPTLKPERIAGAGGLRSRHDAMVAGENGADYVMFGEPDRRGHRPPFDTVEERVQWWADLVEVPCVGYAGTAAEVAPLRDAGADFIALGNWLWNEPQGAFATVAAAAKSLAAPAPKPVA
jgi:thiamine-phosphate pyrophosphorylase